MQENEGHDLHYEVLQRYKRIEKIGTGTYGVVYRAIDSQSSEEVALKKMKLHVDHFYKERKRGYTKYSIERDLSFDGTKLRDVIADEKKLNLVFDFHEQDLQVFLSKLSRDEYLDSLTVKAILYQILSGVAYCHSKRIMHRDLKPQNILIDKNKRIKIADFGLARPFSIPNRPYTQEVATLWYRAPEILLGSIEYSTPIDIWSVGVILVELVTKNPLFTGDSEIDQLYRIFRLEVIQPYFNDLKKKGNGPNYAV